MADGDLHDRNTAGENLHDGVITLLHDAQLHEQSNPGSSVSVAGWSREFTPKRSLVRSQYRPPANGLVRASNEDLDRAVFDLYLRLGA
jgi:hypothetical protein